MVRPQQTTPMRANVQCSKSIFSHNSSVRLHIWQNEPEDAFPGVPLFAHTIYSKHVNDVVRAALESNDPSAATRRHQNRINRLCRIKPYDRQFRTMASRAVNRHAGACPKAATDCNRLQRSAD